tara:strand:+ start:153 stop:320 length:168 start_codon:yes stop_codon:yes gene_type:complete
MTALLQTITILVDLAGHVGNLLMNIPFIRSIKRWLKENTYTTETILNQPLTSRIK